jgi:hypothetical protein
METIAPPVRPSRPSCYDMLAFRIVSGPIELPHGNYTSGELVRMLGKANIFNFAADFMRKNLSRPFTLDKDQSTAVIVEVSCPVDCPYGDEFLEKASQANLAPLGHAAGPLLTLCTTPARVVTVATTPIGEFGEPRGREDLLWRFNQPMTEKHPILRIVDSNVRVKYSELWAFCLQK